MYNGRLRVWYKGYELELYTIGELAKAVKRSVETIRLWEKEKLIPKPMWKARNKVRLYHPKEVAAMQRVLKKQGKYAHKDELKEAIWAELVDVRKEILAEISSEIPTNV